MIKSSYIRKRVPIKIHSLDASLFIPDSPFRWVVFFQKTPETSHLTSSNKTHFYLLSGFIPKGLSPDLQDAISNKQTRPFTPPGLNGTPEYFPTKAILPIQFSGILFVRENYHLHFAFLLREVICLWEILLFAHRTRILLINGASLSGGRRPHQATVHPSTNPQSSLDEQIEAFCTCLYRRFIDFLPAWTFYLRLVKDRPILFPTPWLFPRHTETDNWGLFCGILPAKNYVSGVNEGFA